MNCKKCGRVITDRELSFISVFPSSTSKNKHINCQLKFIKRDTTFDKETGAFYAYFKPMNREICYTRTIECNVDIDRNGEIVGIEVLCPPATTLEVYNKTRRHNARTNKARKRSSKKS